MTLNKSQSPFLHSKQQVRVEHPTSSSYSVLVPGKRFLPQKVCVHLLILLPISLTIKNRMAGFLTLLQEKQKTLSPQNKTKQEHTKKLRRAS